MRYEMQNADKSVSQSHRNTVHEMRQPAALILILLECIVVSNALSFQWPDLSRAFNLIERPVTSKVVETKKKAVLLEFISNTNNGKTATPQRQRQVLSIVGDIENSCPPVSDFFVNPSSLKLLNGTWYLQYTSPSSVQDDGGDSNNNIINVWKPRSKEETVPTESKFQAKGSISAVGITVDTSNRVVKQIINVDACQIGNQVDLDFGKVTVGGTFRPSDKVTNRAIVSFTQCQIELKNGLLLDLGFVFGFLAFIRGSSDNGWLETTYVDEDLRIGRGNKGTMFVLTKDPLAVTP